MGDAFEGLPSWVNYIINFQGSLVYLETIEKGISGKVAVVGAVEDTTGRRNSLENPGYTGENHQWWKPDGGPKETLAVREAKTGHRMLTEEEAEVLQDLGLLDYALTEAGYKLGFEEQETCLMVSVYDLNNVSPLYRHSDAASEEPIVDVQGFATVMLEAFKALGFQNRMEITFPDVMGRNKFSTEDNNSGF